MKITTYNLRNGNSITGYLIERSKDGSIIIRDLLNGFNPIRLEEDNIEEKVVFQSQGKVILKESIFSQSVLPFSEIDLINPGDLLCLLINGKEYIKVPTTNIKAII